MHKKKVEFLPTIDELQKFEEKNCLFGKVLGNGNMKNKHAL